MSILISKYGLSFMIQKQDEQKFFEYHLEHAKPFLLENKLKEIIDERPVLKKGFNKINIVHHNRLNTLIPADLFSQNNATEYLKKNVSILENDTVYHNYIKPLNIYNVYVLYETISKYFKSLASDVENVHIGTYFLNQINQFKKELTSLPVYEIFLNVFPKDFQIVVLQNEQLQLYNHFEYDSLDEFLYYLFFVLETLSINVQQSKIYLSGIEPDNEVVRHLKDFTDNIQVLQAKNPGKINNFF